MRYPKSLKENGKIGFVAPSFGCNTEPYKTGFDRALDRFSALGYETVFGYNCYEGSGIGISNTPEKCAQELMEYYCGEDKGDALISCGGGELMCETAGLLDFDRIKAANPKWYMGYSDNTNFTYLLATICDVASVYGPCAGGFGMEEWHPALKDAFGIITGETDTVCGYDGWERESLKSAENPTPPYNITEKRILQSFVGNRRINEEDKLDFGGHLIGGCTDCLVNLLGTRLDKTNDFLEKYKNNGFVWFLESCDLNVFSIRRAMWQMREAGWFRYAKGFLIGRPYHFGEDMMGLDQYDAVTGILGNLNLPIIMDCDIGHLPPAMPLVTGSMADVSVCGNDIRIGMRYV